MSHSASTTHQHDASHGEGDHHHVTPLKPMLVVFGLLLFLTVLTVGQSRIPTTIMSETLHIIAAIAIASIKALLVAAYFMHLRYDKPLNTVVVSATLFALVLFLGFTMLDLASRKWITSAEQGEIVAGGDAHYITGEDGKRERRKGTGLGIVAKATADGHQEGDGHGTEGEHGHTDDTHGEEQPHDAAAGDAAHAQPEKPAGEH